MNSLQECSDVSLIQTNRGDLRSATNSHQSELRKRVGRGYDSVRRPLLLPDNSLKRAGVSLHCGLLFSVGRTFREHMPPDRSCVLPRNQETQPMSRRKSPCSLCLSSNTQRRGRIFQRVRVIFDRLAAHDAKFNSCPSPGRGTQTLVPDFHRSTVTEELGRQFTAHSSVQKLLYLCLK